MQRIDDRIRTALRRSAERCGSILALSRLLNVSHSTVLCWLNGKIRHISTDLWLQKVFPVLEEDLYRLSGGKTPYQVRSCYLGREFYGRANDPPARIPLIQENELLLYCSPLENISSFIHRESRKPVPWHFSSLPAKECFAVSLYHWKMEYDLPWEMLVFFTENTCLTDNELVLLRVRGELFIRVCRFRSGSRNGNGCFEDFISARVIAGGSCNKKDPFPLEWVFPVVAIRIFCRKQKGF